MSDQHAAVQRAYDAAVAPDGYPTPEAVAILEAKHGLADALLDVTSKLDGADPADTFLVGFITALLWQPPASGERPPIWKEQP